MNHVAMIQGTCDGQVRLLCSCGKRVAEFTDLYLKEVEALHNVHVMQSVQLCLCGDSVFSGKPCPSHDRCPINNGRMSREGTWRASKKESTT